MVRMRLPEGRRPSKVTLLTAGTRATPTIEGNVMSVRVPSVAVHEVLALDD